MPYSLIYIQDIQESYNMDAEPVLQGMYFFGLHFCVITKTEYDTDLDLWYVWAQTFDYYIENLQ